MSNKSSFTLIELMIAVSILAVGLVLVLRSYIGSLSALEIGRDKIEALRFLETKINELEEKSVEEDGTEEKRVRETVELNHRQMEYELEITPLPGIKEEEDTHLNTVRMHISWKEGMRNEKEVLFTYMRKKETGTD